MAFAHAGVAVLRRTLEAASLRGARRATRQSQVTEGFNWRDFAPLEARRGSLGRALTVVT